MARNRLQQSGVPQAYGDQSAPGANPYAQNPYSSETAPLAANNPYAGAAGGYASYPPNSGGGYPQGGYDNGGAYGQQDKYSVGGGDFWSELNNVNALLDDLQGKVQAVHNAHSQTLNSTDARAVQNADLVAEEARVQREACKNAIKRLFKLTKGDKAARGQAETASKRFQGILNEHRQVEKDYRQRSRDKAERQYKIVKPDASPEEIKEVIDSENPQVFATALLSSGRYGEARGAYKEVQDRHAEILKVEKTMTELAQMFNEMAMLVEQQDESITQVEQNAFQVNQDIENGNVQLDQAREKAIKARRKKWICFWICVVIAIAIALAVGIPLGIQAANKK